MLVLSRKQEQTIQIGDNIRVTIFRIKGNCVRVGVEAPPQVRILREELLPIAKSWEAEVEFSSQQVGITHAACK
jgi:carbon storage regulator CsrA